MIADGPAMTGISAQKNIESATWSANFDEHISAFLDVIENNLDQPRTKYRNTMPVNVRASFVFSVFPGELCSDERTVNFEPLLCA